MFGSWRKPEVAAAQSSTMLAAATQSCGVRSSSKGAAMAETREVEPANKRENIEN